MLSRSRRTDQDRSLRKLNVERGGCSSATVNVGSQSMSANRDILVVERLLDEGKVASARVQLSIARQTFSPNRRSTDQVGPEAWGPLSVAALIAWLLVSRRRKSPTFMRVFSPIGSECVAKLTR